MCRRPAWGRARGCVRPRSRKASLALFVSALEIAEGQSQIQRPGSAPAGATKVYARRRETGVSGTVGPYPDTRVRAPPCVWHCRGARQAGRPRRSRCGAVLGSIPGRACIAAGLWTSPRENTQAQTWSEACKQGNMQSRTGELG